MKFTNTDISILRTGLQLLDLVDRQILIFRFWENMSIEEIAQVLEMKWIEVDVAIKRSQEELRRFCLRHPGFSLTLCPMLAA